MKMFLIIYAEASDESVTKALKEGGFKAYTKMHGATGEGEKSEPKLGTHYWPGRNNTLMIALPDEEVGRLIELVRKIKIDQPRAGLRAFTLPLEECI